MDNEFYALCTERAEDDGQYAIARALLDLATQLKYLGVGNAATQMGAIELLAMEVKEGTGRIAEALDQVASEIGGIGYGTTKIVDAINAIPVAGEQ